MQTLIAVRVPAGAGEATVARPARRTKTIVGMVRRRLGV
jgi:hypothetical protein